MFIRPTSAKVSSSWADHKNRNPPSSEPGTDYACAYGTPLPAVADGTVIVVDRHNGGADGRRVTVKADNGMTYSFIHLSKIFVNVGDQVFTGVPICESGASAYGSDWGVGPHVHVTLWDRSRQRHSDTRDFEAYITNNTETETGEDEMIINIQGKAGVRTGGAFYIADGKATFLGKSLRGVPTLDFDAGTRLSKRVSGIG